jgi:hypothetical protein
MHTPPSLTRLARQRHSLLLLTYCAAAYVFQVPLVPQAHPALALALQVPQVNLVPWVSDKNISRTPSIEAVAAVHLDCRTSTGWLDCMPKKTTSEELEPVEAFRGTVAVGKPMHAWVVASIPSALKTTPTTRACTRACMCLHAHA